MTLYRIVVTNGVPSVQASVNLNTTSGTTAVLSAVAVSSTAVRVSMSLLANSAYTYFEYLVSYASGALSVSSATPVVGLNVVSNNRRGYLIGTASWLAFGVNGGFGIALIRDRAASSAVNYAIIASDITGGTMSQDYLGAGLFVMSAASLVPIDNVIRPSLGLYYATDYKTIKLDEIRVPSPATFSNWTSIIAVSPTLVIAQYKDNSGNYAFVEVSVSVTTEPDGRLTGALGLYGPHNGGALGTACAYPLTYSGTVSYVFRQVNTQTGTCLLNRLVFNAANTGNELSTSTANDVSFSLGRTGTALSTTTPKAVTAAVQYADTLLVLFSDNAGSSTCTLQAEVFSLA